MEAKVADIWNWLVDNKEWLFSGAGLCVVGLVVTLVRRRKKLPAGDTITTHGDQSPGKVEGNYEVRSDERR